MRNVIKRIANIVFVVVVLLLAAYTFLMAKYPEKTEKFTYFRIRFRNEREKRVRII